MKPVWAYLRLTEKQFTWQVLETAELFKWRATHFRPARTLKGWRTSISGDAGFPDLTLARPPRVIFAELKVGKGKLSPDEEIWREILEQCPGIEYYLWTPEDWEEIELVLRLKEER